MGTLQSVKPIEKIEQYVKEHGEFYDHLLGIRQNLNDLELKISNLFPEIDSETAVPHLVLQQALKDYYQRLDQSLGLERIKKSEVNSAAPNLFPFSFCPSLLGYLSQFGDVGSSEYVSPFQNWERSGVFLKSRSSQLDSQFLGLIEISNEINQVSYSGYVPIKPEQSKLFAPVYHLSPPPKIEGINFIFVRLFAERKGQSWERYDAYANRGIEFP